MQFHWIESNLENVIHKLEPIGSVGPKINEADELNIVRTRLNHDVRLLCNAQSRPVPAFRYYENPL